MADDQDLFGSSGSDGGDDTDDLIAASNLKPAAKPKRLQKKSAAAPPKKRKRTNQSIPDADNDSGDDDHGPGLFDDSDDDDDDDEEQQAPSSKPTMSKRDKLEALRAKRRPQGESAFQKNKSEEKEEGYDSGDSYNSADFMRTKEDDDFIDRNDDDPDAINELYAEQNFHDERPLDWEQEEKKKKKKQRNSRRDDEQEEQEQNPIMLAVSKMKKKKRTQKKLGELEEEVKEFLTQMERAADLDDGAIRERRPATAKLNMLPRVLEMLARRDLTRLLLDFELLGICKRWIQPLPNGTLGNVTLRQQLLDAISKMTGNDGVNPSDLKRSEFGKVVMTLYMHKSETPAMKRQHKKLIEQWSRPIFQKSGNMRDLQHVGRQAGGLTAVAAAARASTASAATQAAAASATSGERDIQDMIASGSKSATKESSNRVHVPFSKGFQYSVRPQGRTGDVTDKRMVARGGGGAAKDTRGNLNKRMTEKGRASAKNQRSANISIEGRPTK
jgi:transcription factor SPN1